MITVAGMIIDNVMESLKRKGDKAIESQVWGFLNRFYFDMAAERSWAMLRKSIELHFSDSSYDDGLWLPSDLAGIDRVRDDDDGFDYVRRDGSEIEPDEEAYRFNAYVPDGDSLFYADDAKIFKGGTTFESAALGSADHTGEYIRFGSFYGFHKLTAALTFTPAFQGENQQAVEFHIRPRGTQKMMIYDPNEEEITDRDVTVHYWSYPSPLYRKSDPIMLPSTRALELMVTKEALVVIMKRQLSAGTYDEEIKSAKEEAARLNPDFQRSPVSRNVHNEMFDCSKNPFGRRA